MPLAGSAGGLRGVDAGGVGACSMGERAEGAVDGAARSTGGVLLGVGADGVGAVDEAAVGRAAGSAEGAGPAGLERESRGAGLGRACARGFWVCTGGPFLTAAA